MLTISKQVVDEFIQYATKNYPKEACGMLLRSVGGQTIEQFIPIPNASPNPIHEFEFEPKSFIRALHIIENEKKEWVGVIHSHPTSIAYPSSIDIQNWFYPELSYWIYSLSEQDLKAYSIRDRGIQPYPFILL